MLKHRKYVICLLTLIFILSIFCCNNIVVTASEGEFYLTSPSTVKKSDIFTVTLVGTNLANVYGYEAKISFDTDILTLVETKMQKDGFSIGPVQNNNETVCAFTRIGDAPELNGKIDLVIYTFKAKDSGKTKINLNSVKLANKNVETTEYKTDSLVEIDIKDISDGGGTIIITPPVEEPPIDEPPIEEPPIDEPSTEEPPSEDPSSGEPPTESFKIEKDVYGNVTIIAEAKLDEETGIAEIIIEDKLWEDFFLEAKIDDNGNQKVVLDITGISDVDKYSIKLPSKTISEGIANKLIEVKTDLGTVEMWNNIFKPDQIGEEDTVTILLNSLDKSLLSEDLANKIGDRPTIEINVIVGTESYLENMNAPITIYLDYQLNEDELEDHEHIVVCKTDNQSLVTPIPNSRYEIVGERIKFTVKQFGKYVATFIKKTFDDTSGYPWAKREIEVLASKGVIKGVSDEAFEPSSNITRADFTLLLVRCLELEANVEENFNDVEPTDYYYNELGIAKQLGLAKGQGGNRFNPREFISRQDMMVLIDRALKIVNKVTTLTDTSGLDQFADTDKISDYAVYSIATMVKEGIIKGDGVNINPLQNTLRAEAAVVIYRIYNK